MLTDNVWSGSEPLDTSRHCSGFKISYLNVQGLGTKNLMVNEFGRDNLFYIFCINEHWNKSEEITYKLLDDYDIAGSFCREQLRK